MYSFAVSTAAMKLSRVKLLEGSGSFGRLTGAAGRGSGRSSAASASSNRTCALSQAAWGSSPGCGHTVVNRLSASRT